MYGVAHDLESGKVVEVLIELAQHPSHCLLAISSILSLFGKSPQVYPQRISSVVKSTHQFAPMKVC
jgi:hypothetical protein